MLLDSRLARKGGLGEWDVERALFPSRAVAFIRESQPDEWAQMATLHGADLESLVVEHLTRELDLKGSLDVLRHGFRFYGQDIPTSRSSRRRTASTRTPSRASSATNSRSLDRSRATQASKTRSTSSSRLTACRWRRANSRTR